ncbi:MAG: hypothetical protein AB1646_12775 [Thermodesulfobacteriota bacterium]
MPPAAIRNTTGLGSRLGEIDGCEPDAHWAAVPAAASGIGHHARRPWRTDVVPRTSEHSEPAAGNDVRPGLEAGLDYNFAWFENASSHSSRERDV